MSQDTLTAHFKKNQKNTLLRLRQTISLSGWLEHFCTYLRIIVRAVVARLSGRRPAGRSLCWGSRRRSGAGGFIWGRRLEYIKFGKKKEEDKKKHCNSFDLVVAQTKCELFWGNIIKNATDHKPAVQVHLLTASQHDLWPFMAAIDTVRMLSEKDSKKWKSQSYGWL